MVFSSNLLVILDARAGGKPDMRPEWSVVCGAKVPRVRKFHGTKVLRAFAPEERKFHRSESSMERKFLDFSLPGSACSTERKIHGSESSLYGLFAPGNESAEERKGQLPLVTLQWFTSYNDTCCASCPLRLAHSSLAEYPSPRIDTSHRYLAFYHLALYPRSVFHGPFRLALQVAL